MFIIYREEFGKMKVFKITQKKRRDNFLIAGLGVLLPLFCLAFTFPQDTAHKDTIEQLLDNTMRVDIKTIEVVFDYYPEDFYVRGSAVVTFNMRPGQTIPLIHFDPAIRANAIEEIRLNGETLRWGNALDVKIVNFSGSSQAAIELQRTLPGNIEHILEMRYRLSRPEGYPRFSSEVSDLTGRGNEESFPCINFPNDLALHTLTFRVHGDRTYRCIGSGLVEKTNAVGIQEWILQTEREIASYTVMFVLVPDADVYYQQRNISGVDVRIMAFRGGASIENGFLQLQDWIPELTANLGPFPMPRGISIFLTSLGGGMEYYGGTISSLWALNHEVFHMYFGCSTIAKTYRDSWMDEAINEWYEGSVDPWFYPMFSSYRGNWVGARAPISVGFDRRAYDQGAHIIQAVAAELGGRHQMITFLRYIQQNYSFSPFDTFEFAQYIRAYSGVDMTSRFVNWLYNGEYPSVFSTSQLSENLRTLEKVEVDMTPPKTILRKYILHREGRK